MGEVLPFKRKEKEENNKTAEDVFADVARRNKENKERIEKERNEANKKILQEYRIFPK